MENIEEVYPDIIPLLSESLGALDDSIAHLEHLNLRDPEEIEGAVSENSLFGCIHIEPPPEGVFPRVTKRRLLFAYGRCYTDLTFLATV